MIRYDIGKGSLKNWIVAETPFSSEDVRKFESILCQGNGYMGIRGAAGESYEKEDRCILVAGTFDYSEEKKVPELPDSADITGADIWADGQKLRLTPKNHSGYLRTLNLKNGLSRRQFFWKVREGVVIECSFERFVSLSDLHAVGERIYLRVLEGNPDITVRTGIKSGGKPHFTETQITEEKGIWQCAEKTHESKIDFVTSVSVAAVLQMANQKKIPVLPKLLLSDSDVFGEFSCRLSSGSRFMIEKMSRIATSRDRDFDSQDREEFLKTERQRLLRLRTQGWDAAFQCSEKAWDALWEKKDVKIAGDDFSQLSIRFAIYHLTIMAPLHDKRMNIGAKGLSGRRYSGHTFWDTEIYMLPFYVWTDPRGARSLMENRYLFLDAARRKAREKGYEGAMYPWQTAWETDTETSVNPFMADYEHHVTADVAFGVYYYYEVTHDMDFMLRCGCEILFETAKFWCSRAEWNEGKNRYEICNVIGPDEYTHDADNNAFTNYMVFWNLELAIRWYDRLAEQEADCLNRLDEKLSLKGQTDTWKHVARFLYLPSPQDDGVLPQDDTFLSLSEIDLTPYRRGLRKLKQDYPNRSYKKLRVAKQADTVILLWLFEGLFPKQVKKNSFSYYERYCVHESSLSFCAYSLLAADIGEDEAAWDFYKRACRIDLGEDMASSDEGIHAASLGGVWQCVVLGFLGIRMWKDGLKIIPHLPDSWQEAKCRILWRGQEIGVTASKTMLSVESLDGKPLPTLFTGKGTWKQGTCRFRLNEEERL